jgi:2-polyprenyl-3-methyl-5-hydroxy-6-metoxy-1,4-benzoquinol methylase
MDGISFHDEDVRKAWNGAAEAWEEFVESGADYYRHDVHGPALMKACGAVTNRGILDLGCGQGFFTRQLAKAGANVVAIDLSERQIDYARTHEEREPLGIAYHVINATEVSEHFPSGSFDLVTACMSMHDMAQIPAVLRNVHAVLSDKGRLVFSISHPCTDTPFRQWEYDAEGNKLALKIFDYFKTGPSLCHWRMVRLKYHWDSPYWRHTLSEWSALLLKTGFWIRQIYEPRPSVEQVRKNPELEDAYRLPAFIIFDTVRVE